MLKRLVLPWVIAVFFLPRPGMAAPDSAPAAPAASSSAVPASAPDSLIRAIEAAGDSSAHEGAGAVVVSDRTEVQVERTGLGHVRRVRLVKILTEEGARDHATLRFDYDPASNAIRIDEVRLVHADGTIDPVDPAAAVDHAAPADMIYWGARMKVLSLPRLRIGDAIETRTYKKGYQIAYLAQSESAGEDEERYIPPMRGHFYDVVTFRESLPIEEKSYRLRVYRDKPVQFAVYNGELRSSLAFSDSFFVYTWEARDVPGYEPEPRSPDDTDILPKVVLATVESWQAKSRWFYEVNEPVFEANEGIRRTVENLTKGLRSDDEKMAVLLHWVAQEIRYSGLSMGKGEGYTLHPGVMSFEERCGVCKDIAGMLVTMLRAAGFTTYPVMTNAGSRVEAVPADQFNHCVVAVERADGSFAMLDPTWAPFDRSVWSRYEGEQHYVIGSPRGEGLSQIRAFTPEESRLTLESRARLHPDGTLEGTIVIEGAGGSDARLRGGLGESPAADRMTYFARVLSSLGPGIEVVRAEATDPRDFSRDTRWSIAYRVPRYAAAADSILAFVPPAARIAARNGALNRMLSFTKMDSRENEALLWFTQELIARDIVEMPAGFRAAGGVDSVRVESPAASMRARSTPDGARLRAEVRAVTAKRTVPAEEWAGAAEAADSLRAFGLRLVWAERGR